MVITSLNPDSDPSKIRQRGIALFISLVMLTFLFVLGLTFISVSSRDYVYARYVALRAQALYLAESGIEYAQISRINWTEYPHTEEIDYQNGKINIEVNDLGDGSVEITSYGKYASFTKGLKVIYGRDGTIQSWEEL